MTDAPTTTATRIAWVDLSSTDAAASRDFYRRLFGWEVEVNPDPQYGGYALARVDGRDVAGIGGTQSPDQPTAWNVYVDTADVDDLARRVQAAGGKVAAPPFDVGDQGRMAVFQDPAGAFISAWQGTRMNGFQTEGPNTFGYAELNARGVEQALPFYRDVFGWTATASDLGGQTYYTLEADGRGIAGATEIGPDVPPQVPSYWMVYFDVDDIDGSHRVAVEAGAREVVAPAGYPGGRFSILTDPQGAMFGLFKREQA